MKAGTSPDEISLSMRTDKCGTGSPIIITP
jgi:hypothetical protein